MCVRELLDPPSENRPRLGLELLFRQVFVAGEGGPCGVTVGERGARAGLDDEVIEYLPLGSDWCLLRLGGYGGARPHHDHRIEGGGVPEAPRHAESRVARYR